MNDLFLCLTYRSCYRRALMLRTTESVAVDEFGIFLDRFVHCLIISKFDVFVPSELLLKICGPSFTLR